MYGQESVHLHYIPETNFSSQTMVSFKTLATSNERVDCEGQRALVTGGTQGIGAGIALRFALCGASVWIVGRNESKARSVLDQLRLASAEAQRRKGTSDASAKKPMDHTFFQADLSKVEDIKRVAEDVSTKAGRQGIDYLVETQGGPPTGRMRPPATASSPEGGFAVQCLSRVALAHLLTEADTIRKGVCFVAAPSNGSKKPLNVDDLDFSKALKSGQFSEGLFSILKQGQRDSSVLDAAAQVLAERNPRLSVTHLFPGFVATGALANSGFPWPLPQLGQLFGYIGLGSSPTPGSYPEVPFYLHANPEASSYIRLGQANLFNDNLKRSELSPNVREASIREQVYGKLMSYLK